MLVVILTVNKVGPLECHARFSQTSLRSLPDHLPRATSDFGAGPRKTINDVSASSFLSTGRRREVKSALQALKKLALAPSGTVAHFRKTTSYAPGTIPRTTATAKKKIAKTKMGVICASARRRVRAAARSSAPDSIPRSTATAKKKAIARTPAPRGCAGARRRLRAAVTRNISARHTTRSCPPCRRPHATR